MKNLFFFTSLLLFLSLPVFAQQVPTDIDAEDMTEEYIEEYNVDGPLDNIAEEPVKGQPKIEQEMTEEVIEEPIEEPIKEPVEQPVKEEISEPKASEESSDNIEADVLEEQSESAEVEEKEVMDLSAAIVVYSDGVIGESIGRGECWDFVAEALDVAGADWERPRDFGRVLDWKNEDLQAGDVLYYRKSFFRSPDKKKSAYFFKHFGLVYETGEDKSIKMVHQNYADNRTVHFSELNLNHLVSGTFEVFRPKK